MVFFRLHEPFGVPSNGITFGWSLLLEEMETSGGGPKSSCPKVISPEVMSPETRVMSPEILSHVTRNFNECLILKKSNNRKE